jgi:hypothetical protein
MDETAKLSDANRAALAAELMPGETLLWAAEPSSGMRVAGFSVWLVAIPFVAFGLFWTMTALVPVLMGDREGWLALVFGSFGLPFLGMGLIAMFQPFRMRRNADHTVYAFTDRRLIRLVHGSERAVSEVPLDAIGGVDMVEYSDGSGTLTINTLGPDDSEGGRRPMAVYQILGVQDVARARTLLRERIAGKTHSAAK